MTPEELAKRLKDYVFESVKRNRDYLYRVYVHDCEPLNKNVPMPPIEKTDKSLNLGKTDTFKFRTSLLDCLRQQPYFAVRLGEIDENNFQWKIKNYDKFKQLLYKEIEIDSLTEDDFVLDIRQKGVDMKIGLDIATLSIKKQIEKIILITADSDFIPAIKHARKEGVIVQLDPMRVPNSQIKKGLLEHIDILSSVFKNTSNS
ncbi:NYN domain-containing protein [Campylobacter sp. IFREMER_LSEM_CL1846]|uniref:NYN domain-containing protein n=1 Tax=Campylobacter sp. IFREMER_LSEM_CL1846 TaxID=2911614 RepID=UPI0021E6A8C4|nr:NYN domain-containing protein [Campylobacter sp. IFREMER_LSEM_CL1846]HEC1747337.1 NYN domain-containing protein [Campylobacter lari]MCV3433703.1 NYN domain-containing protein [Campylobacter sp. IFREMER_LSEM_CL1846]HEC1767877.1 NYN domain-containing protein [Campylobacter lari]HEC1789266.1 NYN domain-containing protein [Campylobacter lari]HEC1795262.1 NYN domain-containing protein [Campylobacter lari]